MNFRSMSTRGVCPSVYFISTMGEVSGSNMVKNMNNRFGARLFTNVKDVGQTRGVATNKIFTRGPYFVHKMTNPRIIPCVGVRVLRKEASNGTNVYGVVKGLSNRSRHIASKGLMNTQGKSFLNNSVQFLPNGNAKVSRENY